MKTIFTLTLAGLHQVSRGLLASQGYLSPAQLQALEQPAQAATATRAARTTGDAGKTELTAACCA